MNRYSHNVYKKSKTRPLLVTETKNITSLLYPSIKIMCVFVFPITALSLSKHLNERVKLTTARRGQFVHTIQRVHRVAPHYTQLIILKKDFILTLNHRGMI